MDKNGSDHDLIIAREALHLVELFCDRIDIALSGVPYLSKFRRIPIDPVSRHLFPLLLSLCAHLVGHPVYEDKLQVVFWYSWVEGFHILFLIG